MCGKDLDRSGVLPHERHEMNDNRNLPEAELARLADGSLPESRAAELRAQVQESAELQGALAEQQRAVAMLRAVDQPAPDALRARIDELTGVEGARAGAGASPRRGPRWRRAVVLPGATALAVVVAIAVIVIGGGRQRSDRSSGGPAGACHRDAAGPGGRTAPIRANWLASGAGIPFPNWAGPLAGRRPERGPTRARPSASPPSSTRARGAPGSATRSWPVPRCELFAARASNATACASPTRVRVGSG